MNLDKAELLFFLWASEWSACLGSIKSGVAFTPPLSSLVQAIPTVRERRAHSVASRNMSWNQLSVFELSNQSITKSLPCLALTALPWSPNDESGWENTPLPDISVSGTRVLLTSRDTCHLPPGGTFCLPPGTPAVYLYWTPVHLAQLHLQRGPCEQCFCAA